MLKSAYEIAMEKTGGSGAKLTDEQKKLLSEIDEKYAAQIAEKKILMQDRLEAARRAGDAEAGRIFSEELANEIAQIEARREKDKAKARGDKS